MKKINVGIIGCGSISNLHTQNYQKDERCNVIAVCDINKDRAKNYAQKYGVEKYYSNSDEMYRKEKLDAVSVCTWNSAHAPETIKALDNKVNVLCEKPLALNAKEAKTMKEASIRNKKLLMVGFVRRFGFQIQLIKEMIEEGQMGKIYHVYTNCLRRVGCPGGWFAEKQRSGGGPLIDLGVHIIDMARYLMGNPKAVSAYCINHNLLGARKGVKGIEQYTAVDAQGYNDVEDMSVGIIRFEDGQSLVIETSWTQHIKKDEIDFRISGTKAGASFVPELEIFSEDNNILTDTKPVISEASKDVMKFFEDEISHYIDCIADGVDCISPLEDGVEMMKILDAMYDSAKTGHDSQID